MQVDWDTSKTEEELFAENEYLIRYVIKKIPNENVIDTNDLYQEGAIALLKVIRKIKEGFDIKNTSYIETKIMKRIRRYIQYQGTSLHLSKRMQFKELKKGKANIDRVIERATTIPINEVSENAYALKINSAEDEALINFQLEEIKKAVERLPQSKKRIMREYFSCEMNIEETARRCGCSTRTVYYARAFLREKIRQIKILEKDMCDG